MAACWAPLVVLDRVRDAGPDDGNGDVDDGLVVRRGGGEGGGDGVETCHSEGVRSEVSQSWVLR